MSEELVKGLQRPYREEEGEQGLLFDDIGPSWVEHWWGMPAFVQKNATPVRSITVNFMNNEDVKEFARRLGVNLNRATDSMWFPKESLDAPGEWEYYDEP